MKFVKHINRFHKIYQTTGAAKSFSIITDRIARQLGQSLTRNEELISFTHEILRRLFPERFSDASPLKKLYIDPSNITKVTGSLQLSQPCAYHLTEINSFEYKKHGISPVFGGSWDKNNRQFKILEEFQAIRDHLMSDVLWENTDLYQRHSRRIKQGYRSYGCYTVDELNAKFDQIDSLINRIKSTGYQSSNELGNHPLNEVRVNIDRNGQFLYNDQGRHRLAIAKVLNIDKIPVLIMTRHKEWQKIRKNLISGEQISQHFSSHPDLVDVRS